MFRFKLGLMAAVLASTIGQSMAQEQAQSRFPDLNPAVAQAIEVLGTPYRWGGTDPLKGFDCSGLIQYVFGRLQVSVPRMPVDLFKKYNPVTAAQLLPGTWCFSTHLERSPTWASTLAIANSSMHRTRGSVCKSRAWTLLITKHDLRALAE